MNVSRFFITIDFSKMWIHTFLRIFHDRFKELALPLVTLALTQSPLVTALVLLSQQVGTIFFSIPIGTWVERRNPVIVSSCGSILTGLFMFALAYAVSLDHTNAVVISFLLCALGIVSLFHSTAFHIMVPKIVGRHRLLRAHTLLEMADAIVTLLGPALGGYLLATYGASTTLAICGGILLTASIFLISLRYDYTKPTSRNREPVKARLRMFTIQSVEGLTFLFKNSAQRASTLALTTLGFSTIFITLTLIFHASSTLQFSEQEVGLLLSSAGLGNIIGVLIINRFKQSNWLYLLVVLLVLSSLGVMLLLTSSFWLMCFGMMLFDGALSMGFVVQVAVHQGITPDSLLARVRSATYVIGGLVSMIATILSGLLTELNSLVALGFGSLMLIVPAFLLLRYRHAGVGLHELQPLENVMTN
ncbi:MFS transporter [Shouchella sp. 1P09AA]|uniref:MFS transporter n=1 Tax=unclassified Shouchella TaxID=2893065 RepID=UPI0039A2AF6B